MRFSANQTPLYVCSTVYVNSVRQNNQHCLKVEATAGGRCSLVPTSLRNQAQASARRPNASEEGPLRKAQGVAAVPGCWIYVGENSRKVQNV